MILNGPEDLRPKKGCKGSLKLILNGPEDPGDPRPKKVENP